VGGREKGGLKRKEGSRGILHKGQRPAMLWVKVKQAGGRCTCLICDVAKIQNLIGSQKKEKSKREAKFCVVEAEISPGKMDQENSAKW